MYGKFLAYKRDISMQVSKRIQNPIHFMQQRTMKPPIYWPTM